MNIYKVPVYWEEMAYIEVEAQDEEEAIEKVKDVTDGAPLPDNHYYVEDSFNVETDPGCVI